MIGKYYLYRHVDPTTGNVVYVGIGTKERAWLCRNRQPEHQQWLDNLQDRGYLMNEITEIIDSGLERSDALVAELELIDEERPVFNRNYVLNNVCKLTQVTFELAQTLKDEGWTYQDISKELDVSPMTIHRALSGGTKKYEQFKKSIS